MADLLKEFFERDLTDAEEQALADQISASTDKSLRFAQLAKKAYRRTGLPDPSGSGGGMDLRAWGPIVLQLALILSLGGSIAYGLFRYSKELFCSSNPAPAILPGPKLKQTVPAKIALAKPKPAAQVEAPPPAFRPISKPGMARPVAYDPDKKYEGLDVIVEQRTAGLVTVRAIDGSQKEIRVIFAGLLKPGKWDLTWDGKLENGEDAVPGLYQVQVQNGKNILTRQVIVQGTAVSSQK